MSVGHPRHTLLVLLVLIEVGGREVPPLCFGFCLVIHILSDASRTVFSVRPFNYLYLFILLSIVSPAPRCHVNVVCSFVVVFELAAQVNISSI